MLCDRFDRCRFFAAYKNDSATRQYEFLLATFCEGKLMPQCKRLKWRAEKHEDPPAALLPNGYLIMSTTKFYD